MAHSEGMALSPWGVLGGGKFKSASAQEKSPRGSAEMSEGEKKVSEALEKVAGELGGDTTLTRVALASTLR